MRPLLAAALAVIAAGAVLGLPGQHGPGRSPGPRVAFASGDGIDEIDLAGRERRTILKGAALGSAGFAVLPDGSFVVSYAQRLVHFDARGRRLGDLGPGVLPALSPDGSRLAFAVLDPSATASRVGVMNADGSGRRMLTSGKLDTEPGWSPDGTTILFTRYSTSGASARNTHSWLETIPVSGGTSHRLTNGGYDTGGHYSPDGQWIAFASGRGRTGQICGEDECRYVLELFVMRADGSDQHRIGRDQVADGFPVFATPTTIVYSRADAARFRSELYRIELDGSCRARLTRDALQDELPAIAPGSAVSLGGCLAPTPLHALSFGPNFDELHSGLTPARARVRRGLALWWVGATAQPFVLTAMLTGPVQPVGGRPPQTVGLIYGCSPDAGNCARALQLIEVPVCSRPTLPATGRGAVGGIRGVPRIRYADRDELLVGRTIVTIYGDRAARALAERELRSLSPSAGHVRPGQPLPSPPTGILDGIPCQPPAVSGP